MAQRECSRRIGALQTRSGFISDQFHRDWNCLAALRPKFGDHIRAIGFGSWRAPTKYNLPSYGPCRGFEIVADIPVRAADHPVGSTLEQMRFKSNSKQRVQMLGFPAICDVAEQEQQSLAVKLSLFDYRRPVRDHHVRQDERCALFLPLEKSGFVRSDKT